MKIITCTHVMTLVVITWVILNSSACINRLSRSPQADCYAMTAKLQVFAEDSVTVVDINDTIPIYIFEDFMVYKIPHINQILFNWKVVSEKKAYEYFIFKKGDKLGYLYPDSSQLFTPLSYRVDSMLKTRAYKDGFSLPDHFSPIFTKSNRGKELRITYLTNEKKREMNCDTIQYSFAEDKNVFNYSMSPLLDSIYKKKFYRLRLIFNPFFSHVLNKKLDGREYEYSLIKEQYQDVNKVGKFVEYHRRLTRDTTFVN